MLELEGSAKQKAPAGRRQSRSHRCWQREAPNKKYNRFIRLNLELESLPLCSAEPSQGELHRAGVTPRPALVGT